MLCRNCGAENPDSSKFCVHCGAKLDNEPAGAFQPRNISDRHYSLDEIARQQSQEDLLYSGSSYKSAGVDLHKHQISNDAQSTFKQQMPAQNEESYKDNSYFAGSVTGESYKLKSAGFDDEKEPVKPPSITDAVNSPVPPQSNGNHSFGNTYQNQNQNNSGFGSNTSNAQNNYSYGGTYQNQNNSGFGSNTSNAQNNYSYGGTYQNQNNSGFGSNTSNTQNNYSYGGTYQNKNNSGFGANTSNAQNNNSYGGTYQNQNNSGFGSNTSNTQNNYSYGGTYQNQNNSGFGSNTSNAQNNYSYGGTYQNQNNSGFGSNTSNAQNNYSYGGTYQNQNNSGFGSNTSNAQNNNYSFGNAAVQNQNNSAKVITIILVILAVVLIGGIIWMLSSGYYSGSNNIGENSIGGGNIGNGNIGGSNIGGGNIDSITENIDYNDVLYSNQTNFSIATQDDDGNVYYLSNNNRICKKGSNISEDIYNSESMCLNYYKGKIYFISKIDGYNTVCSINTDGSDFKTHTKQKNVSMLVVSNGYAYYVINNYGASSNAGALFRVDIESGKVDNIIVEKNSGIYGVYDYGDSIYVHSADLDTYVGIIRKINKNDLTQKILINSPTQNYDYYSVTLSGGKFYTINYEEDSKSYSIYSMDPDGSNGKKLGGTINGENIAVYGDYIYYTEYNENEENNNYALFRMKTDGTEKVLIKDKGVTCMSLAQNKIYYIDDYTGAIMRMDLNGLNAEIYY